MTHLISASQIAITSLTFQTNAQKFLQIVRYNECGVVINPVGDHYYTLPQLIAQKKILGNILGKYYERYIFVYIDASSRISEKDLTELLAKAIKKSSLKIKNFDSLDLGELIDLAVSKDYEVAFFISRAENLFLYNEELLLKLETLSRQHRVSLIYFSERNLTNRQFKNQQNDYPSVFQNVIYLPFYDVDDANFFISYNEKLWRIKVPLKLRRKILDECGGNLWLIRQTIRYIRDNPEAKEQEIFSHFNFRNKASVVWEQLFTDEQEVVNKVLAHEFISPQQELILDFLLKIRFLKKDSSGYSLTIPVLKTIIKQKNNIDKLTIKNGSAYFGDQVLSSKLTLFEEKVLNNFLSNPNLPLSRNDIAKAVWRNDEKGYSDWALDKIISRLRKKLEDIGLPKEIIKTKKGHGYVFKI